MARIAGVFLDTSVLLPALIEIGEASASARRVLEAVADGRLRGTLTAWHCCLEFYSVATRLPEEYRVSPADAVRLLEEDVFPRCAILDLPRSARRPFLREAEHERVAGGRIYDAQIAEIARRGRARIVVTGNVRHFTSLLRHEVRVLTPGELLREIPS